MTTWLVWTGDKEHDPVVGEADEARILPDGSLALGGWDKTDLFVFTAIFAPGAWTWVNKMPSAQKLRLIKEGMSSFDIAIEEALAKNP